jgi:hypothetical protein
MTRKIIQDQPPQVMFDPSKIKLVDPRTLKLDPKNRNKHPPEQIDRMVKLYKKFGMRWPVLVSEKSDLVKAGEGRVLAAIKAGMPLVPVTYQEFENDELEYAFGISDNAIAAWSELDLDSIKMDIEDFEDLDHELLGIEDLDEIEMQEDLYSDDDVIDEVNKGDENSEWVGMPEFEEGKEYIKLIYHFKSEIDRELFVKENEIQIDKKMNGQWIVYHQ